MHPLQYDLRSSAAKDNSITHAAAAPSNLDAATTMRSAETELQNILKRRATVSEIAAPKPDLDASQSRKKTTILKHFLKWFLKGKLPAPKLRTSADRSLSQPGCSHSNTIYDLQLQKTIVLRMQPRHQATLTQPLQCDQQPRLQETHRTTHTGTATCCRTQRRNQTTAAAPAAHTRYLSSPAAATLHEKTQGFLLRLPPHNKGHATFMQPFQCDLQPRLQETHRTTHTGTTTCYRTQRRNQTTAAAAHTRYCSHFTRKNTRFPAPASTPQQSPCNIHAAIPMRSATTASRNA